jgi:hypothetical protein
MLKKRLPITVLILFMCPLGLAAQELPLNAILPVLFSTYDSNNDLIDADSTPTCSSYSPASTTPIHTVNATSFGASTGKYLASLTLSSANGYVVGTVYRVQCTATVATKVGVVDKGTIRVMAAENVAGTPQWAGVLNTGTAQAGAASTITLASAASSTNAYYSRSSAIIVIVGGTGSGQARKIISYVGSTRVATVDTPWVTNPNSTSIYAILPSR